MKPRIRSAFPLLLLSALNSLPATPTENLGLRLPPAPGEVVVDGKFGDWDLSGGVFACDDAETQRDKMAVWFHAQYDARNLYILAHFQDETPLNNPGQTIADYGFAGDSLQIRTITGVGTSKERGQHFTAWRGRDGADLIKIEQGKDFKEGVVENAKATDGAQQAFSVDPDGKGYIQELAIPWSLLTRDGQALKPGETFQLTVEPNFTLGAKGRFSIKDIFKAGLPPDRVFTFMSSNCWGTAVLEAKGRLTPKPVRLADAREFPTKLEPEGLVADWTGLVKSRETAGIKTIDFELPFDGYVSLNITGADQEVRRQLLTCTPFSKGRHSVKWDGLTNWSWTRPGEPAPEGGYTWSAIAHRGLGLKLRGWAANSGKAPWDSADGRGNWGGDHGIPTAVAADATQVYLGWSGSEAGKAVLAVDPDGHVLWSNNRAGISGVRALAAEGGVLFVLGGPAGPDADGANLYKLDARDGSYLHWEGSGGADLKIASLWPADAAAKPGKADAVSIVDGHIHLSFRKENVTLVVNSDDGKFVTTMPGVSAPRLLSQATAKDGLLCTWKGEPDNQILVTKDGREIRRLGQSGGRPLLGPWEKNALRFVSDMAVDTAGKLWVTEADGAPKRISVWDPASGQLVREFFGPSGYGALGGSINPVDPDVMVGQGCEWRIDPKTGQAACLGVVTRDGIENSRFALGANGRLYLAVTDKWAFEAGSVKVYERLGDALYKLRCVFRYEGRDKSVKTILWTDANDDAQEHPEEITTADREFRFSSWFMNFGPDLTVTAGDRQLKVTGFTACGAPRYDLANPVKLPAPGLSSADTRLVLQPGSYGETHTSFNCFDTASGRRLWSYPDNFNGVHGSHNACPPAPGMIRGSYGLCGTVKLPGPVGNLYVIPTNVGEWHLLTGDGFYLSRLFEGDPLKVKWPDQAIPGADMSRCPPGMGGEDFGGSATLGQDGKLYLQAGKTAFWNLEVTGLETVTAIPGGSFVLSADERRLAGKYREEHLQLAAGARRLTVKKGSIKFTGSLEADFKGMDTASFQKQEETPVRAAAAWDDTHLYLAWDVRDSTPLINGAETPESMYLGGDTVDFQLGADPQADPARSQPVLGDLRLSIGDFKGRPTAVIYRPVSVEKSPMTFSSGVIKSYLVESVQVLKGSDIQFRKNDGRYLVEAAVPLSALGIKPDARTLRGDFGVTYGDGAGKRTRLRNHWSNQHTGLVDDAVFELMLEPKNWGELTFE